MLSSWRRRRGARRDYHAYFDAGLDAKAAQDWAECARVNRLACTQFDARVAARYEGVNPAAWNLGIAATALGDWRTARTAWRAYGIDLPEVDDEAGPIDEPFGSVPIRLNPDRPSLRDAVLPQLGETEVVWCRRASPAHAVIVSVPLPGSGHHWGDVLLHDGEPKGHRRLPEGAEVPVFDELAVLGKSGHTTWRAELAGNGHDGWIALSLIADEFGVGCDDWSHLRMLCSDCSHGAPDAGHQHSPVNESSLVVGLAGPESTVRAVLDRWAGDQGLTAAPELERVA